MSVTIEKPLRRDQVESLRRQLAAEGILFVGDAGTFERGTTFGSVAGAFRYDGETLRIDVTKKPRLVSWTYIHGEFSARIEKAVRV